MNDGGPDRKNPAGPAGQRAAAAIAELRRGAGLPYTELAARLEALGRPIPVLGLSRLERGDRRIDADDLVALALALEATPNRLILPGIDIIDADQPRPLTATVSATPGRLWAWAQGEEPLPTRTAHGERKYWFIRSNKPYLLANPVVAGGGVPGRDTGRSPELQDKLGQVVLAIQHALAGGLSDTEIRCAAELALSGALGPP